MDKLQQQIEDRFDASYNSLATKRDMWDEVEAIFANQLNDSISQGTKSQVMDQKLSGMILEREARVMNKLAIGKYRPISSNDIGSSKILGLTVDKYIIPNANAQFPFLIKLRMLDRYSNIYGNYFAMIDWDIKKNGYIGPDMWLLPIRDVYPQVGAVSLTDSDYIIVRTWKPLSFFKGLGKSKTYKNLPSIIKKLEDKTGDKDTDEEKSARKEDQYPDIESSTGDGYFEVLTMFERDHWVDYVPAAQEIFRDIKNPHDNGELPIVCKHSIPLIDDFMGMGDMERGKTMQYTLNSLWNLYLDAIKISIFPPTILNKDNIIASTIKWGPGAKWLVRNSVGNSVQQLAINPRGIESFQATYQTVNASLLNLFGTTDTAVSAQTDPGFGRTPQALKYQMQRENSKDSVDRFYMEEVLTEIMRKIANLWSKKQPSSITMRLFRNEIEELAAEYPEIKDYYNEDIGKLTINRKMTGSTLYDYEIVSGSTYAVDQQAQQQALHELLGLLTQNLQIGQDGRVTSPIIMKMLEEGKEVKISEIVSHIMADANIKDIGKIIIDKNASGREITPEEQKSLQADQEQFLQMLQALQSGGGNGQVPTQPQMPQQAQQPLPVQNQPMPQASPINGQPRF